MKIKICPNCGQKNVADALFCTKKSCKHKFSLSDTEYTQEKESVLPTKTIDKIPTLPDYDGMGDAPYIYFEDQSNDIVNRIERELKICRKQLIDVTELRESSDKSIRKAYGLYVDNFNNVDVSMRKIVELCDELVNCHKKAETKLENELPARKDALRRAYDEKRTRIHSMVKQLIDDFAKQKPFDKCRGYQISPVEEWGEMELPIQHPQYFLFVGKISRTYSVLGEDYTVSRREYIELLNSKNLIVHHNNKSKELSAGLVTSLLCRLLKTTAGQLIQISVVDSKMGIGLNPLFKDGLPSSQYRVIKELDVEGLLNQEGRILQMTEDQSVESYNKSRKDGDNLYGYHIIVVQDWYATLGDRIIEDEFLEVLNNSVKAGYCFIFMVNDDNKPTDESRHRYEENDLLSQIPDCVKVCIDSHEKNDDYHYELLSDSQIIDVVNIVRENDIPQSRDIDVGSLIESKKKWKRNCKQGLTLYIGKDRELQDVELKFSDDNIHQSLLVNYRGAKSKVFPWVNALIAQAFTLYDPKELNIMVADFTGNAELSALVDTDRGSEKPFCYLDSNRKGESNYSKIIGSQLSVNVNRLLVDGTETRLLVFVVGSFTDMETYVINKPFFNKNRLHFIFLTTDTSEVYGRQSFNGYVMSFGPERVSVSRSYDERSLELSGSEFFLHGGGVCQAYTYSAENTRQIINKNANFPETVAQQHNPMDSVLSNGHLNSVKHGKTLCNILDAEEIVTENQVLNGDGEKQENAEENADCAVNVVKDRQKSVVECDKYGYDRLFKYWDYMLPESEWWKESCDDSFDVPFGIHINSRTDEDETLHFRFIDENAMQNAAFILGEQGSGKSNILNNIIIGGAQKYSPKELEFYLFDFKSQGFKPYELYDLPHIRVVTDGDDPDFNLNVLNKLKSILNARKKMDSSGEYPRTILVIDECHHFFIRNDAVSIEARKTLDTIIREGRTLKINVIFATQKLQSDGSTIPDTLYSSIGTWMVAQPSDDSYRTLFHGRPSTDAKTLRSYSEGEMMYAPKGVSMDRPIDDYHAKSFYIQYNPKNPKEDSELKKLILRISEHAKNKPDQCPADMKVYKYHAADIKKFDTNRMLDEHKKKVVDLPNSIPMYLGQALAMTPDIYINLKQRNGENVLIIGAADSSVGDGIAINSVLSGLWAYPKKKDENGHDRVEKRIDYLFDFTKKEDPLYGKLKEMIKIPLFNCQSEVIDNDTSKVVEKLNEIKEELKCRKEAGNSDNVDSHIFITFIGLENASMFGKQEDSKINYLEATDSLKYILKNGPAYGIFTVIQCTGTVSLFEQKTQKADDSFNHIIALLMEDSTLLATGLKAKGLYDREAAQSNPGLYRAIYYDKPSTKFTKFKPYKF